MPWLARYALTLLLGGVIGFVIAWQLVQPQRSRPLAAPSAVATTEPAERVGARPQVVDVPGPTTLAEIMLIPGDYAQSGALYNLAANVDRQMLEALLDEAASLTQLSERRAATSILYGRYAELDPREALEHILDRRSAFSDAYLRTLFYSWSRQDLESALAAALAMDGNLRAVAGGAILMARDDLAMTERWDLAGELALEAVMARIETQNQLAQLDGDPAGAWQMALEAGDPNLRMQRLHLISEVWARQDPLSAMVAAAALGNPDLRLSLQHQIVRAWGRDDPHGALDWLLAQPPSQQRSSLLPNALEHIAPEEALDIIETLGPETRTRSLIPVLHRWARQDPRAAVQWLDTEDDHAQLELVYAVAGPFAQHYPEEAVAWANDMPEERAQAALQVVLQEVGRRDPTLAVRLVNDVAGEQLRITAVNATLETWAQANPQAAAEWASMVEGVGDQRGTLIGKALQTWYQFDRAGAVAYLDSIGGAATRDAATMTLIRATGRDVAAAEALYLRLQTGEFRQMAAQQLFYSLRERDPARAERYRAEAQVGG